jgi:hypothetical protein
VIGAGTAFLARQMRGPDAEASAEVVARLVLSYLLTPGLATDAEARRFARRYVAPLMTGAA